MKYEYLVTGCPTDEPHELSEFMNQYGKMGWELVTIGQSSWISLRRLYFKRPLP